MNKTLLTALLSIAAIVALIFVRFESQEGHLEFSHTDLSFVNSKVGVAQNGAEADAILVNVRIVFDLHRFCAERNICNKVDTNINNRYMTKSSLGQFPFAYYQNCSGERASNCIKIKDAQSGYDYNSILVGNINLPTTVKELKIQFPLVSECACGSLGIQYSEATLKISTIDKPLYKFILDAILSV